MKNPVKISGTLIVLLLTNVFVAQTAIQKNKIDKAVGDIKNNVRTYHKVEKNYYSRSKQMCVLKR